MIKMDSKPKETELLLDRSVDSGYGASLKDKFTSAASRWKTEDKDCILRHFRFLKDELYVKPLVDLFFQNNCFDEDDMEEVIGQRSRRQSVDIFLRKLMRLNAGSFDLFLDFLRQTEQVHIADTLQQNNIIIEDLPYTNLSKSDMETRILMNLELLCDDLEPDKIADYFLLHRVFNVDEYESVINHRTRRKKAEEMVGLILENLPQGFLVLKLYYMKMGKENILHSLHNVSISENQHEINMTIREQFEMKKRDLHCSCMLYPSGYYNAKMSLHVYHRHSSEIEKTIVESLQSKVGEINKELRHITDCKLLVVKYGSVVFHLLNCGPLLRNKKNLKKDVDTLLQVLFVHPAEVAFGCYDGFRFNVTIEIPTQKIIEGQHKDGILTREALERNRDCIIEELSALPFLRHKKASKIFQKSDIDSVLNSTSTQRESRMNTLLSIILRKGDPAVRFFEMVLKKEKQTNIFRLLSQNNRELETSSPTGSYAALIDEMSPSLIARECKAVGLDIGMIVEKGKSLSRKQVSKSIVEHALCQDNDTKQRFLWIFGQNYPDQVDFGATPKHTKHTPTFKKSSRCRSYDLTVFEEDCLTLLYQEDYEIDRKEVRQIEIQAEHLTTKDACVFNEKLMYDDYPNKTAYAEKKNEIETRSKIDLKYGLESQTDLYEKSLIYDVLRPRLQRYGLKE